ncbi:MAG: hypothetical protein C0504_00210 [Candidatus Solibacter sp.]|nr:hypothetical protein [Candidatus Solibacter sp.]
MEEVIKNRANEMHIVTHTRVFEFGQVREVAGREDAIERESATFDPAGEVLTVRGTLRGLVTIEDIRWIEYNGVLHVIRDVYPNPDDSTLYSGRNLPVALESTSEETDWSKSQVRSTTAVPMRNFGSALASSAPRINGIGGVTSTTAGILNGRVSMSCGTAYNGAMAVNDQDTAYYWYISGMNFGATAGTVTLAGRTAKIIQWTATQITAAPTVPWTWGPMSTLLTVKTSTGTSTTYGIGIAPAIRTRAYSQCTWFCARQRLAMGKTPSPSAYSTNGSIDAQYSPKAGDQYQWAGSHAAIVTQVSGPVYTTGGYKTWTLQIGQYNARCTNSFNAYTTTFQTRTTTAGTAVTKRPQSSITSYGSSDRYYR